MHKKIHLAVTLALLAMSTTGHGASLPEITERALARNPEVSARIHEYLSSGHEQEAARGGLRPRIDAEAYYGREWRDTPSVNYGGFNHPGASLQLRQLLFDGFATSHDIRRLGHAKAMRYYELLAGTDDIAVEAARAYLDVQRYRQLSQLAQDNWMVHKDLFTQIEQRVTAGVGRRVDLEQAGGRLALAQSNWLTETSNLHDVSARFERIVGEAPPALAEAPDLRPHLPPEAEILPIALRENPTFLAAVSNLRSARAQTDVRRSAYSPTLEFRASTSREHNRQGVEGSYSDRVAQLVLNYNLYRGGSDEARIRQAQEQYYAAVDMRDKTCRDIRQNTVIAWNDVRRLREQLQFLEAHALATQKARDAYRQQFDIGQRTLLDLLDTENELFEARRALTRARYDLKIAEARVLGHTHRLLASLGLAPAQHEAPVANDPKRDGPDDGAARCSNVMPGYEPITPPSAPVAVQPVPEAPKPVEPPKPTPAPAPVNTLEDDISGMVRSWAAAWSARDLDAYMRFYSENFQPKTLADRQAWRKLRARRLDKPEIDVQVANIKVKKITEDMAEATFNQHYDSPDYKDKIVKTLVFTRENGRWKILRELAPPAGTN